MIAGGLAGRHPAVAILATVLVQLAGSAIAEASVRPDLDIEYRLALDRAGDGPAQSRLSFRPGWRWRGGDAWQFELSALVEAADDRTGLGRTAAYSPASRPLVDGNHARLELDRAVATRRRGGHRISIGKQVVPWGVLDGIQVSDRFDAIRRRDFVYTSLRPERIARWGLRWRHDGELWRTDLAVALDPTANQQASAGDRFEAQAPRLRGGLPAGAGQPGAAPAVTARNRYLADATWGVRVARSVGRADASALLISGPDTDPVLTATASAGQAPALRLDHRRRTVLAATVERPAGARVWRLELAHIPNQPVNVESSGAPRYQRRARSLAGVGVDWNAPHGWFVNAQLALDHLHRGQGQAVRPRTDLVLTLRGQRGFLNDTVTWRSEWLLSPDHGDGVLRTGLEWRLGDALTLATGADWVHGARDGLFGQYRDSSQLWSSLRLRY